MRFSGRWWIPLQYALRAYRPPGGCIMRMGNFMWGQRIVLIVMAATPSRPGIRHVTVVPTNLEEAPEKPNEDEGR